MVEDLRELLAETRQLKRDISKESGPRIAKSELRNRAEAAAQNWFSSVSPGLTKHSLITSETIERYSALYANLLKLIRSNNLQTSYLQVLASILKNFHDDLVLPIQTEPKLAKEVSELSKMLANLPNPEEDIYLKEAIACATHGLLRASAVLGWCAAIDRIHRAIEKIGFAKFNTVSQQMTAAISGRFKRFSSPTNIGTLSDLREVFDSNILWILEGMQLIDGNQHTRLRSCFELRCQCGHPGDAPVTEYNLLSFFSDINAIVLRNSAFEA